LAKAYQAWKNPSENNRINHNYMKTLFISSGQFFLIASCVFFFPGCAKQFDSSYNNVKLTIDSIVPMQGGPGTPVRIYGKGFAPVPDGNKVNFNSAAAAVDSNYVIGILLAYAPQNGSTGNVSVVYHGDSVQGPVFTYLNIPYNPPFISNVTRGNFLAITGNYFDPANSIVTIGGEVVPGFTYQSQGNNSGVLSISTQNLPFDLGNPDLITVSVNSISSNAYSFLFPPQIINAVPDTVTNGTILDLKGEFFGNQSAPSSVNAFFYAGSNQVALSPAPSINSWNLNSIKLTIPNYSSYFIATYLNIYIQVNVGNSYSLIEVVYSLN
jgi:hypothetical protein